MDAKKLYEKLDERSKQQLRQLAKEIGEKYIRGDKVGQHKGRVILFLGAAVNYHSEHKEIYSKEDRPPLGDELRDLYIDEMFKDNLEKAEAMKSEKLPLNWVSQYYEEVFSRRALIDNLSNFIDNKKPSPILKALAKMPFRYIVTTNYDHLFEDALESVGKTGPHKGIYKPNKNGVHEYTTDIKENDVTAENPFIYKLHGDIRDAFDSNGEYLPKKDSIVLTDEDYLHFILRMSQTIDNKERDDDRAEGADLYPVPQSINKAFTGLNQNTFLFIGYGLRDYNLRLIFKTSMWKKDSNIFRELQKWSIDLKPDEAIRNIFINDYKLTFIEWDIWCAIPYLYKQLFNEEMPLD
jgi:hypothetical protein